MSEPRKPDRQRESVLGPNKRLHCTVPENRPSWKRRGEGVANVEFTFYRHARGGQGALGIVAEETAFANKALGDKRDTTKTVMMELDRASAAQLHQMLGEMLGIPDVQAMRVALRQAHALMSRPGDFRSDEFKAVRDNVAALVREN